MGGSALLGPIGGLIGNWAAGPTRRRAEAILSEAQAEIESIGAAPDMAKEILLKKFESAGILTPEIEQGIELAASKVAQIQEDPSLRSKQQMQLAAMQQIADRGMSEQDIAAINQMRREAMTQGATQRANIVQEMQRRGRGAGGAELMAQLSAADAIARQAAETADRQAAMSADKRQAAIQALSGMASGLRSQDFGVAQAKAGAEDARSQAQFQANIGRQSRNVAAKNAAQEFNLRNMQNIANMNVQQDNAELQRQRQGEFQNWQNQVARAQMRSQAQTNRANAILGNANATSGAITQGFAAGGQGLAQIGQYALRDEDKKNKDSKKTDQVKKDKT